MAYSRPGSSLDHPGYTLALKMNEPPSYPPSLLPLSLPSFPPSFPLDSSLCHSGVRESSRPLPESSNNNNNSINRESRRLSSLVSSVYGSSSSSEAMVAEEAAAAAAEAMLFETSHQHQHQGQGQMMRPHILAHRQGQIRMEARAVYQHRQQAGAAQPSAAARGGGASGGGAASGSGSSKWGREMGGGESKSGGSLGIGFLGGTGSVMHRLSSLPSSMSSSSSSSSSFYLHHLHNHAADNQRLFGGMRINASSSSSSSSSSAAAASSASGANAYDSNSILTLTLPFTSNNNAGGGGGGSLGGNTHGNAATAAVFVPCTFNEGRRPGYLFRKGDFGWGYYLDPKQRPPRPPSAPTLPLPVPRPAHIARNTFSVDIFERLLALPLVSLGTDSFNAMVTCIRREELASARIARQRAMNAHLATLNSLSASVPISSRGRGMEDGERGREGRVMEMDFESSDSLGIDLGNNQQGNGSGDDTAIGGNSSSSSSSIERVAGVPDQPEVAGVDVVLTGEPMDVSMGLMAIAGGVGVFNDGGQPGTGGDLMDVGVLPEPPPPPPHPHQSQQQQQEELQQPPATVSFAPIPPLLPNVPYHHTPVVCPNPLSESHVLAADLSVSGDTLVSLEGTRALPANHFNPQVLIILFLGLHAARI